MDRAELRFRARQEFAKRQDGLFSFLRFDFAEPARRSSSGKKGNFFFTAEEVTARFELLRERLPEQAEEIIRRAEKLVEHRFDLLGHNDLAYGSPIDWHLDFVHGKRAAKEIFYRVPYLDFAQVGDSKITWELNRHQHFVTLAKAYRLTGDARYADEILRQWRHWWAENPYPIGINWASSLECAFRSLSWLWTCHLLEDAPGLPSFRQEWLRGFALHGRHIERYLSTYFSPNTHLLGEGVGLFFLGVLCPELEGADRWKAAGWKIILEEARRQVQSDGFHFEQSTYYHVYALDFLLHSAVLASANDVALPQEYEETLQKMLSALCLLGRGGPPPRLGDDDGGRVFDPRRNGSEHLLDPLATGAILFNRGDFKAMAGGLREETILLLGAEGVKAWDALEATAANMDSAALPAAGLYLLTAERPPTQLVIDCGPLGVQSGGHGHADSLSINLQSEGRSLLIDSGTFEYVGDSGDRNLFRGTGMHNTLRVDRLDQAEAVSAFAWGRFPLPKAEQWIQGRSFDLFVGSHDGYERLGMPVTHRRWVFSLRNGFYLVRDAAEGQGKHELEISWHLSRELQLVEDGLFRVKGASQGLALLPSKEHGWAVEVERRASSPVYGQKAATTVLTFSKTTELPATFCCAIVTLQEALRRPGVFSRVGDPDPDSVVNSYRYAGQAEEYLFFFADGGKRWQSGSISSDAEFVCWCRAYKGAAERLILVNGSAAEVRGGCSIRFSRKVSWGERIIADSGTEIFSSDLYATADELVPSSLITKSEQ